MTRIKTLGYVVLFTLSTVLAGCTVGDVLMPNSGGTSAPEESEEKDHEGDQR